jgi:hypothetical protein
MGLPLIQNKIWLELDFELVEDPLEINCHSGKWRG